MIYDKFITNTQYNYGIFINGDQNSIGQLSINEYSFTFAIGI